MIDRMGRRGMKVDERGRLTFDDPAKIADVARERALKLATAFKQALAEPEPDRTVRVAVELASQVVDDLVVLAGDLADLSRHCTAKV